MNPNLRPELHTLHKGCSTLIWFFTETARPVRTSRLSLSQQSNMLIQSCDKFWTKVTALVLISYLPTIDNLTHSEPIFLAEVYLYKILYFFQKAFTPFNSLKFPIYDFRIVSLPIVCRLKDVPTPFTNSLSRQWLKKNQMIREFYKQPNMIKFGPRQGPDQSRANIFSGKQHNVPSFRLFKHLMLGYVVYFPEFQRQNLRLGLVWTYVYCIQNDLKPSFQTHAFTCSKHEPCLLFTIWVH